MLSPACASRSSRSYPCDGRWNRSNRRQGCRKFFGCPPLHWHAGALPSANIDSTALVKSNDRTSCDSPLPLKRRGFSLCASYAGLRSKPYTRGRSHNANYWAGTQILSPDVDRAHPISVPDEPAAFVGTAEDAPSHLAAHPSAFGTGA